VESIKEDAAIVANAYRQRTGLLYQCQRKDRDQHGETIPETAEDSVIGNLLVIAEDPTLKEFPKFACSNADQF
jgi:hypothetical protein